MKDLIGALNAEKFGESERRIALKMARTTTPNPSAVITPGIMVELTRPWAAFLSVAVTVEAAARVLPQGDAALPCGSYSRFSVDAAGDAVLSPRPILSARRRFSRS